MVVLLAAPKLFLLLLFTLLLLLLLFVLLLLLLLGYPFLPWWGCAQMLRASIDLQPQALLLQLHLPLP
jgi:hypothetical protein